MRPARCFSWLMLAAALLAGCGRPSPPAEGPPPSGPLREHWQMSHRVPESRTVRVVGQSISGYSESTRVSFDGEKSGAEVLCWVSISAVGWGGPENKVGEQIPTTVQGRPAVTNGSGAEGDYLLWQRPDGTWAESSCDDDGQRAFQARLADIVSSKPSDLVLPFDVVSLPPGLQVTSIVQDRRAGTTVYLSGVAEDVGRTASDLVLTYDATFEQQPGRATTIGGYPATLHEAPRSPGVCLLVQEHHVCVSAESSDTGPYPDRSNELPVMVAVAETLRFPEDVDDRSSWIPAQKVFG